MKDGKPTTIGVSGEMYMKQVEMTVMQRHTVRAAFYRHGHACWRLYVGYRSGRISLEDALVRVPYLEGNRRRLMNVYGSQHSWRHSLAWSVEKHDKLINLIKY